MLIALNIGNTRIQIGLFDDSKIKACWSIATDTKKTPDDLGIALKALLSSHEGIRSVDGIAACSVIPSLTDTAQSMGKKYFGTNIFIVRPGINTKIAIKCRRPEEVGADRIADAVGGYRKYRKSLIIVDCGTATTVDYISPRGEFMGGAIAPGLFGFAEALYSQTIRLPRIEPSKPERAIGTDTLGAMNSGIYYGYIAMVEGLISRIRGEAKGRPLVISTGGYGRILSEESRSIAVYDEFLTLEGVKAIYDEWRP